HSRCPAPAESRRGRNRSDVPVDHAPRSGPARLVPADRHRSRLRRPFLRPVGLPVPPPQPRQRARGSVERDRPPLLGRLCPVRRRRSEVPAGEGDADRLGVRLRRRNGTPGSDRSGRRRRGPVSRCGGGLPADPGCPGRRDRRRSRPMSTASVKSLAEKRVRRQKQFIAVGSVVLLAVLGFELPKVLGGHSAQTAPVVTTSSTSVGSLPPVAPGKLPDTDRVVVQRDSNQLLSFGLFKSKDPFVQQLSTSAAPTVPASTTTTPHLP